MAEQTIAGYDDTTFSLRLNRSGGCYNKIQNQYSLEQFLTISLEIKDNKKPPKEFLELGFQCVVETLSSR
jgi:hypothetical protein